MRLLSTSQGSATAAGPSTPDKMLRKSLSSLTSPEDRSGGSQLIANHLQDVKDLEVGYSSDGDVQRAAGTPGNIFPPPRTLQHTSQLPTPQSPNNIDAYTDALTTGVESPLSGGYRQSRQSGVPARQPPPPTESIPVSGSLITPESSPVFSRRQRSSYANTSSPPSTLRRSRLPDPGNHPFATPRPISRYTPSPHPSDQSPPSGLSSPFIELSERNFTLCTPRRSHVCSPVIAPMHVDDVFCPDSSLKPTTPLPAPVPQRAIGGEIERIRLQMAADQAARLHETESRRPEYLKRAKRPIPDSDFASENQENTYPTLGVTESPVKGRRLMLFQETSEESFEQSLLAGGYLQYGLAPAYAEPSTPRINGKTVPEDAPQQVPSDREIKKRKRLAAFQDHNVSTSSRLFPVEIEGRGRVILDKLPEEIVPQSEHPTKKRANRRKKGAIVDKQVETPVVETALVKPNWLDEVFPWSLRYQERMELGKREEEEKLKWIERYLERDSDDEDDEDQSLGLPPDFDEEEEPQFRRGRGKMVPLPINPDEQKRIRAKRATVKFPCDPADARAALLSKRSVRALAFRRRQEEEVVCVCNGKDDGRELVQCDQCETWFHLQCIGIEKISDLGREEDPWYCMDCLGITPRSSSPTFVPTDDRPPVNGRKDPLFFQGSVQESPPAMPWSATRIPKTPVRGKDQTQVFSSRSSWGESSELEPQTPSSAARSTRIYNAPSFVDPLDEPFDPTSTPSRGIKFSGPFTTPKATTLWGYKSAQMYTPSRSGRKLSGGPFPYSFGSSDASSPYRTVYSNDESPVRRSKPPVPRRLPDSPVGPKLELPPSFDPQESPIPRKRTLGSRI